VKSFSDIPEGAVFRTGNGRFKKVNGKAVKL
jgi:hypothetical protein